MRHTDTPPNEPTDGWSQGPGLDDPASSSLRILAARFPGGAAHVSGSSLWLNRHAEDIVGYENADLGSVDAWGRAVYGERDPEARAIYIAARAAGFPRPEILTVTRRDGATRLVEFSAYLGADEELWIMRDVTEAVQAERALREREQRLGVAVTTAGLGIWEWNSASGLIAADGRTRRLFRLGDDDGADDWHRYLDRILDEDRTRFESSLMNAVNTSAFDLELRLRTDHGRTRWVRMHGSVVDDPGDNTRVVGAVLDIDSYKRLDERLVHAAQMESLGQLAGGVAHDFNNLLAVIQGQVEFVMRDPGLTEQNQARLLSIERAVTRGADMVSALMQLGRPSAASSDVIEVHEQLSSAADSLRQLVGADITVRLDLGASMPFVRFDEARLSAVLLNLVSNARDAMPLGGHLSITTRDVDMPDGQWLALSVEDTGVGMDAETRERIFEPFFTTKTEGLGTGIGLASVYDSVLDAGGTIDVTSTPGAGSEFSITLPVTMPADSAKPAQDKPTDSRHRTHRSILVVEDDPAILELTADLLRDAGYEVAASLGAIPAIELVEGGVSPDLLLTDVVMPGMSGPALAEELGVRFPALRVLFMSGYAPERHGAQIIDPAKLVPKPFNHQDLLERVEAALASPTEGGQR